MTSKPISREEARETFLQHVRFLARYWAKERPDNVLEACEGVAFSILTTMDGCAGFPSLDLVLRPHPDDKAYHEENGDDYYVDGMVINGDCHLHDYFHKRKT